MTTFFAFDASPIGSLLFVSRGRGLAGLYMEDHARGPIVAADWVQDPSIFADARRQLAEYFAGARASFDLALDPLEDVATPFQRRVWDALRAIPCGETIAYAELARRVGIAGGARAVGHANARNPISIVVPCHRVVGARGALTGYAGGEERKRWLLDHERRFDATVPGLCRTIARSSSPAAPASSARTSSTTPSRAASASSTSTS